MTKQLTWIGIALFLNACAGGESDDDTMADDSSGSVGDTSSGETTGMTTTMTTAPTTAETLSTTDPATTDPATTDPETSGTDGSTGDTGYGELTCAEYCDIYATSCVDHSEYSNEQDCLDNCAQWPIGEATDTGVDSLGCRIYHATVAGSTDPEMHCPHAGPSGALTCVTAEAPDCATYCDRYFANCEGNLNAFADADECMTECSTWYAGTFKDTDGHTVGCHSYHANAAAADADTHCPHAGPGGGGICVL